MKTNPNTQPRQRVWGPIAASSALLACVAVIAAVGLSNLSAAPAQGASGSPQRHAYCTKEWRQANLPAEMLPIFEDWCEHRPGR